MAEPPEDSLSFAKKMFGGNPFPKDDPRHELWEKTCRIWAEKDARVTAELLEKHPSNLQNPLPDIVELVTGRFNIGAECFLAFVVWNYESVALYEQILGKFMDSWISWTLDHCPRGIEKNELLFQLTLRLTGRMAHWRAEALKLARESQVKRPAATGNLDVNRELQEGQQALERSAAARDSLSSEDSDSAQKPGPRQPLPASVTNGSDTLQVGSGATADRRVKAVFRKSGELWEIGYEGKISNFQDIRAFHFISRLLRECGKEIRARELATQASPETVQRKVGRQRERARSGQKKPRTRHSSPSSTRKRIR